MKNILFGLGIILFVWPLVALLTGLVKKELTNVLLIGSYDLANNMFSGFAFNIFYCLFIIGFIFMSIFSPEKRYIK